VLGMCASTCPAGQICCGDVCIAECGRCKECNRNTGQCESYCHANRCEKCGADGKTCQSTCKAAEMCCGGKCMECDSACYRCDHETATCSTHCRFGEVCCLETDQGCRNLSNATDACGSCGHRCELEERCCDGKCTRLGTNEHCSKCEDRCSEGQECCEGRCKPIEECEPTCEEWQVCRCALCKARPGGAACASGSGVCCGGKCLRGKKFCPGHEQCGKKCCPEGQVCTGNQPNQKCCPANRACGETCCSHGHICCEDVCKNEGECCLGDTHPCGDACCTALEACCNGQCMPECTECPSGREICPDGTCCEGNEWCTVEGCCPETSRPCCRNLDYGSYNCVGPCCGPDEVCYQDKMSIDAWCCPNGAHAAGNACCPAEKPILVGVDPFLCCPSTPTFKYPEDCTQQIEPGRRA
jgi:Stigma-specific protein, Stig1